MVFLFLFISGACLGSFLTVVAERLPVGQSLSKPGSHCTACQQALSPFDLIPIYAFIRLKGRCRYCQKPFSVASFAMECYWGSLFCLLFYVNSWQLVFLPLHLLLISSCLLSLTDVFYWIVEPKILYSSFLLIALTVYATPTFVTFHFWDALAIYCLFMLLTTVKKDSLGGGDIKLLTGWTLFLGTDAIVIIVFIGSALALFHFLVAADKEKKLPFAPYLSVGLFFYLLFFLYT